FKMGRHIQGQRRSRWVVDAGEIDDTLVVSIDEEVDIKLLLMGIPKVIPRDIADQEVVNCKRADLYCILQLAVAVVVVELKECVQRSLNILPCEGIQCAQVNLANGHAERLPGIARNVSIQQYELMIVPESQFVNRNVIFAYGDYVIRIKIPVFFENLDGRRKDAKLGAVFEKIQSTAQPQVVRLTLLIGIQAKGDLLLVPDGLGHELLCLECFGEILAVGIDKQHREYVGAVRDLGSSQLDLRTDEQRVVVSQRIDSRI